MGKKPITLFLILLVAFFQIRISHGQDSLFTPRPKLIEFEYSSLTDYFLKAEPEKYNSPDAEVDRHENLSLKLTIPLILKSNNKLGIRLRYLSEEFNFENVENLLSPVYSRLEDRSLRSYRFRLLGENKVMTSRSDRQSKITWMVGWQLNGDRINAKYWQNYLNVSGLAVYNWQKEDKPSKKWGVGLSFGYDFGQFLVYPLFLYENRLNPKWLLSLSLPRQVYIQRLHSQKSYTELKVKVSGGSYHLADNVLNDFDRVDLRYSAIDGTLSFNREIHDWLWFGVEAGIRNPLNFFITTPGGRRRDAIVTLHPNHAFFTCFRVFVVPPRKLMERKLN